MLLARILDLKFGSSGSGLGALGLVPRGAGIG